MAPQAASQRSLSAVEEAMLGDLGAARIESLPMDDGRFSHQHEMLPRDLIRPVPGPANKWTTAIADGAFNDDDAMQVASLESIADGHLARMHRASRIAGMIVAASYDDQYLRRSSHGQIDPRTRFNRGQRGPSTAGRAHQGDGPVQIPGKMFHSRHTPAPTGSGQRLGSVSASTGPHMTRSGPSPAAQQVAQPPVPASPAVFGTQTPSPQSQQQRRTEPSRPVLPYGASIIFQMPVELASPSFVDRNAKFAGIVYLIAGNNPDDNHIMLRVDDGSIDDVKHSPKEYGSIMTQSREVILQFKNSTGRTTWYVIKFSKRDDMVAFVDALREFIDQPNQSLRTSATAATKDQDLVSANKLATLSETSQATMTTEATNTHPAADEPLPDQSNTEPPTPAQPHAIQPGIATVQQQVADSMVPANLIEDIVSWVINIVAFIRESGPVELARFDALPGVIRGAAVAVLLSRHPDFVRLDQQQRIAYIDEHCAPRVLEKIKIRLRENAAQKPTVQTVQTTMSQGQLPLTIQASTPPNTGPRRLVYTREELLHLRPRAGIPPHWLTELSFLKDATRSTRERTSLSLQWDGAQDAAMPKYKHQIQKLPAKDKWLHNGHVSESLPSSTLTKDDMIGLFVANASSDSMARELLAEEDQDKIVQILPWGRLKQVLLFRTAEERDEALYRISDGFKAPYQWDRSLPRVEVFLPRYERGRTKSAIDGKPGTSRSSDGYQSHSPREGHSTQTAQASVIKTLDPTQDANVDTDTNTGDFRVQTSRTRHGIDGHSTPTPELVSIDDDAGPTPDQLKESTPLPHITITAPTEYGSASGARSSRQSLGSSSDPMRRESEQPSFASDRQSGLNASRFNTDRVDLLGGSSGSWTGVLAKDKSYVQDLMGLIWKEDPEVVCAEDPVVAETVNLLDAMHFN
ncbi:hypothetical protein VPNG_06487 [Cytospora leucostoma]|uniref:RNA-binding domain-containing protein n=1 Tax=Cytospora leucostoma TaxID=1230097 RepID=A0A423X2S0_9PEZI|nr:hypothetical protein VPNG_06487 [Cytospora leucostoma]